MTTTNSNPNPKRRWFAFRLRTLFVLVAILALPLAWLTYTWRWLGRRYEARTGGYLVGEGNPERVPSPLSLRVLGVNDGQARFYLEPGAPLGIDEVRALFPESRIEFEVYLDSKGLPLPVGQKPEAPRQP